MKYIKKYKIFEKIDKDSLKLSYLDNKMKKIIIDDNLDAFRKILKNEYVYISDYIWNINKYLIEKNNGEIVDLILNSENDPELCSQISDILNDLFITLMEDIYGKSSKYDEWSFMPDEGWIWQKNYSNIEYGSNIAGSMFGPEDCSRFLIVQLRPSGESIDIDLPNYNSITDFKNWLINEYPKITLKGISDLNDRLI